MGLRRTIWRPTSWGAERALEVFDNAETLSVGHFDLASVLVFALPLVILFAPRRDTLLLALGPVMSLVGILVSGAPLGSADTWLRTAVWVALTGLYGAFWLALRRRDGDFLMGALTYAIIVLLIPGIALALASLVAAPPSRVALAQQTQAALRPVMAKTSQQLAPFYESHPEYVEGDLTAADYDRRRTAAEAQWNNAVAPLVAEADSSASTHRLVAEVLAKLSPAGIFYTALLETAGTGLSRQTAFEESAREFGKKWAAELQRRIGMNHPMRPDDLAELPKFQYQEQSLFSWLLPAGIGLVCLILWVGVANLLPKRA